MLLLGPRLKVACIVLQVFPPGVGAIIAGSKNPHSRYLGRGIAQLALVVFGSWPLIVPRDRGARLGLDRRLPHRPRRPAAGAHEPTDRGRGPRYAPQAEALESPQADRGAMKVVLVTGTSSGIGRAAVHALRAKGCRVVATARNLDDIQDLAGDGVDLVRLDVTDDKSRRAAVKAVLAKHGRIDGLVNNAGYGAYNPMEETDIDDMRAMFEVNVFGMHALTQLVLPTMRAQGSGRIVNVASIVAHLVFPTMGAYSASKFAVRSMTEALDMEMRRFGIRACLIEPGRIKTGFHDRAIEESAVPDGPYAALQERMQGLTAKRGAKPEIIAKRIARACTSRRPPFHAFAPLEAKAGNLAKRLLPDALIHRVVSWYFGAGRSDRAKE